MPKFLKPVVVISRCLCGDRCRYDGEVIQDKFVQKLKPLCHIVKVCPEVDMGLPIPRAALKTFFQGKKIQVIQLSTGKDLTQDLERFANIYLEKLKIVDGFILKSRSPSCGLKRVKKYYSVNNLTRFTYTKGLFAKAVLKRFPSLAIQDEDSLSSVQAQKDFLKKVFSSPRLKKIRKERNSL